MRTPRDAGAANGVPTFTRRDVLRGTARVGAGLMAGGAVGMAAAAGNVPSGNIPADPRILAAYARWLHDEARLLAQRMSHAGIWPDGAIPAGTGLDVWHFGYLLADHPAPGHGPDEEPAARAARVLRAAGVDVEAALARSTWRPMGEWA